MPSIAIGATVRLIQVFLAPMSERAGAAAARMDTATKSEIGLRVNSGLVY